MGSERFQSEYIEYLQNRNAELLNRLTKMKEIYENKIFSKDLNQHYFISTLVDILNVCTAMPEEIDILFDKMSEAMSVLINVLSRKSALIQLGEKVSKLLNSPFNGDLIDVQGAEENNNSKSSRKAGTVKVSPMINGHIISTEPRIYLSRVSGDYISNPKNDTHRLSPILEVSPDVTSDSSNVNNGTFKDHRVTSERLNLNHAAYNYLTQESPKGRFKGTKIWKKSLSSNRQTENKKDTHFTQSNENLEKLDVEEIGQTQSSEKDSDPMEGPSWLYDETKGANLNPKCYIDFRRRRHRYARIFENKDKDDIMYLEKSVLNSDNKYENIPSGEPCDECDNEENLRNLDKDSSGSFIETDEESICTKNRDRIRKRKKCSSEENFDSDTAQNRRSSRHFTGKKGEKSSDDLDSSYEGDNEENFGKSKSAGKSNRSDRSKSKIRSKSPKSLPRESSGFDCQETEISVTINSEYLKPMPFDINLLIKDALGKEAQVLLQDCMKAVEASKKEKLSRSRSNTSESNSKSRSPTMNLTSDKKISAADTETNLNNQNQRSKRKAAPTNLTEPKLGTKLRRN